MINVDGRVSVVCALALLLASIGTRVFANDDPTRAARLGEAHALMQRGNVTISQGDFVTTELLWLEALEIYQEEGSLFGQAGAFDRLGKVALAQRAYDRAADYQMKALEVTTEAGAPSEQMGALGNLAHIAMEQGLYSVAEGYHREAIALMESTQPSDYMHILLNGMPDLTGDDTPAEFAPALPEDVLRQNIERLIRDLSSHSFAYLSLMRHVQADMKEAETYLIEYSARRIAFGDQDDGAMTIFQLAQFAQRLGLERASCWYAYIAAALQNDNGRSEASSVIRTAIGSSTCSKVGEQL